MIVVYNYLYKNKMDQCVKLSKLIKENNLNQFTTHLGHCSSKLSPKHLTLLMFDVINCNVTQPEIYFSSILDRKVDINLKYTNKDRYPHFVGKTILMAACQTSKFQTVLLLIENKNIKVDIVDDQGQNSLFYALRNQCEEQSYQMIHKLLEADETLVNSTNNRGNSILFAALEKKSIRIIQLLLKNSANPNFMCKQSGNTVLHKALLISSSKADKKKDLILLLLNYNADPMAENKEGKSAFDIAKQVDFQLDWLIDLYDEKQQSVQEYKVSTKGLNSVTKQDQNSIDENISFTVSSSQTDDDLFRVENLTEQILHFSRNCQKRYEDSWKDLQMIYEQLRKIGNSMHLKIEIIGSYATGLWTPQSDIDIVFTNLDSSYIQIDEVLSKIYTILKQRTQQLGIRQIYLNKNNNNNSFPNIKIDLQPKFKNLKIDITIFQKKNNGQKYVRYICDRLNQNFLIKPVFFTFHRLLKSFHLGNPTKNGLKTYTIFLMLLISLDNLKSNTVGELFINTIYYYTYCFAYEETLNSQNQIISKMNIYDPLNASNNVGGRKTDVNRLREMLKVTDYGLRLSGGKNILEYLFSLPNIFQK